MPLNKETKPTIICYQVNISIYHLFAHSYMDSCINRPQVGTTTLGQNKSRNNGNDRLNYT